MTRFLSWLGGWVRKVGLAAGYWGGIVMRGFDSLNLWPRRRD